MSQITTKFIEDNAVNDLKIRLRNNLALRARNAANTADIDILKISNTDILEILREMSMTGNKITNLADPTAAQDAATKQYVDSVISGLTDPKDSVRAATTAALPAVTYANGALGVGATLTANANGALASQDGVALAVGNRLLVKNQVSDLENGIYVVTALGNAGAPWVLTRATDANIGSNDEPNPDAPNLVSQGLFTMVSEGVISGGVGYILTSADPLELGVSSLSFVKFGEIILAGQGLNKTGSTLSVDNGAGLGFSGNALVVLVDDADLIDGTTKISSGKVAGRRSAKQNFTLNGTDISNQYVDLSKVANRDSVKLQPKGGPKQAEGTDFSISYLGGAGGKTRVTFLGDLATGGNAALIAGDILYVDFTTLDY